MNTDLFGRPYVDPMPCQQIPLFHQPAATPVMELPGTTAADRKIERKFQAAPTDPLFPPAKKAKRAKREPRGSISREFEASLRVKGIPYVVVDEAKRALFTVAALSTFHFVVYSKTGDNWLVLCREPGHENRTEMQQWQDIFGDGYKAVFAVKRVRGVEYRTLSDERLKIEELL